MTATLHADVPCPRCARPLQVPFVVGLLQDGNHLDLQAKLADHDLHTVLVEHFTANPDCGGAAA